MFTLLGPIVLPYIGLQGDFRCSEYCQSQTSSLQFEKCDFGGPKDFALADILFFTASKVQTNRRYALNNQNLVVHVKIIFCWQKNGFHGIHR